MSGRYASWHQLELGFMLGSAVRGAEDPFDPATLASVALEEGVRRAQNDRELLARARAALGEDLEPATVGAHGEGAPE